MAEVYELQYKKVHNTLEKPSGDSVYGNRVGQRVDNLLIPRITDETLARYDVPLIPDSPYAIQVTTEHLNGKKHFINSDFYQPEIEYKLDTANSNFAAKPSCLPQYKRGWYKCESVNIASNTFCPLTANFQDGSAYSSLVSGAGATKLGGYGICSHKILVDVSKNYMFQLSSGLKDGLPDGWKIGFQLMCENVAEGTIKGGPINSKHYTQAYTQFNDSAIIDGWNGKPIAINLNNIMDEKFTSPLKYTYVGQDYVNQWAPWENARYQYLIVYLFIRNPNELSLEKNYQNYQFFLYEGDEVAILDHQGTILGFTGETPLTLKVSTAINAVGTWTLQDSGIFTDQNFQPSFDISADGNLVLKMAAIQTTSENSVPLKDILKYLKDKNKELVAVPYVDYNMYDRKAHENINKTRSLKYRRTGAKRMYTESNWVKYINVVRSEKDKSHFYEINKKLEGKDKDGWYSSYVCNPDVHIGAYRFDYFINGSNDSNDSNINTFNWSISFSHESNSNALPKEVTEPYKGYDLPCLSFKGSVFQVAQPKEYTRNPNPVPITLPEDLTTVQESFQKKYNFTVVTGLMQHGQIIDPTNTLPPAVKPVHPDVTILAKAPQRKAPSRITLPPGGIIVPPIKDTIETVSLSAFVKQDKHLYLRPVLEGGPLPGLQVFGNCRAHTMEPGSAEENEVFNALDIATQNTSLNHSAIKWVKMFFQWEVWEWGNKKRLSDPIIGDRFGLWGRSDVVFKKEAMMNINHSPFIYIAQACSWCDSSTAASDKIPFYFEWQDITFAKTAENNIIAFPSAWKK